jgi:hypothetical protein
LGFYFIFLKSIFYIYAMDEEMEKVGGGGGARGGARSGGSMLLYGSGNSNDTTEETSKPSKVSAETGMIIGLVFLAVVIVCACAAFRELVYLPHMQLHPNDTFFMVIKHWLGYNDIQK